MKLRHARLVALLTAVLAEQAVARDPRITTRLYSADEVVSVEGRAGVQATIAFGGDEHIENVAIGNSNSWQVTPNKRANLLFLKPLGLRARTNLTVVTDRHTYLFDLVADATARPVYMLRFTYPAEAKPAPQLAQGVSEEEVHAAVEPPKDVTTGMAADLNFSWRTHGSSRLIPERIYDDGAATYLVWSAGTPLPAILIRNDKGEEGAVNYSVRGDVIVVDTVPNLIILRSGKASATLENQAPQRSSLTKAAKLPAAAAMATVGPER